MLSATKSRKNVWRGSCCRTSEGAPEKMGQEISDSYQAVKSKVYRLIDSLVEDAKTQGDVQESMKRWWKHIHPADRPVARKHLLSVLNKSNATLGAICEGLTGLQDFEIHQVRAQSVPRLHPFPAQNENSTPHINTSIQS